MEFFASCLSGLEKLLAAELKELGIKRTRPLGGGVAFYGEAAQVLRVCLWSRLASRVLCVVTRTSAVDADALYAGVREVEWADFIRPQTSIAVRAHGTNANLRNTHFVELKVKDALCDQLMQRDGTRPDVDTADPDIVVDVRIRDEKATISVDLTGQSLYQRGYLDAHNDADRSIACAMAAGAVACVGRGLAQRDEADSSAWSLVDPACGDGVLVIEAASCAADLACGLTRDKWGLFGWAGFDEAAWDALLDEADERFERGLDALEQAASAHQQKPGDKRGWNARFMGATTSSPSLSLARQNAKRAGLRQVVSFEFAQTREISDLVKRACGGTQSSVVASMLAQGDAARDGAQRQADLNAFVSAAQAAKTQCGEDVAAVLVGDADIASRYGISPCEHMVFGRGRIAQAVVVFNAPPQEGIVIRIPDNQGGAEHELEVHEASSEQFAARLRKVFKERKKWAKREGIGNYRLYDADLPDYAVAIDIYTGEGQARGNDYVHIAEYAAPHTIDAQLARRRFEDVLAIVPVVLGVRPDHVFSKTRIRDKGGAQYADRSRRNYVTHVIESGHLFEVDLSGYLDTGLFLDHRTTRQMIEKLSDGKRVCNLFAYTGSASVYAAAGGATEVCTVDLSQTYLDWARRNMEQNGFEGPEYTFERADVMSWITQTRRQPRRFDFIFVDPPTFSNSKAMGTKTWDVQRDHVELLIGVSRLLTKGGQAIFSCNLRSFKPDVEQLARYGVEIEDITPQTIPHDFERNPKIHKAYRVRRVER